MRAAPSDSFHIDRRSLAGDTCVWACVRMGVRVRVRVRIHVRVRVRVRMGARVCACNYAHSSRRTHPAIPSRSTVAPWPVTPMTVALKLTSSAYSVSIRRQATARCARASETFTSPPSVPMTWPEVIGSAEA